MKTIWKYKLVTTDDQDIAMPEYGRPISVGEQNGILVLWAVVEPENETRKLHVHIYGTGNPLPSNWKDDAFVRSVAISPFVWHVFAEPVALRL